MGLASARGHQLARAVARHPFVGCLVTGSLDVRQYLFLRHQPPCMQQLRMPSTIVWVAACGGIAMLDDCLLLYDGILGHPPTTIAPPFVSLIRFLLSSSSNIIALLSPAQASALSLLDHHFLSLLSFLLSCLGVPSLP